MKIYLFFQFFSLSFLLIHIISVNISDISIYIFRFWKVEINRKKMRKKKIFNYHFIYIHHEKYHKLIAHGHMF